MRCQSVDVNNIHVSIEMLNLIKYKSKQFCRQIVFVGIERVQSVGTFPEYFLVLFLTPHVIPRICGIFATWCAVICWSITLINILSVRVAQYPSSQTHSLLLCS